MFSNLRTKNPIEKTRKKVVLSWSGGKDCARALYELRNSNQYQVVGFLTNIMEKDSRISMHNTHSLLLEEQAKSVALPLYRVLVPENDNILYAKRMKNQLLKLQDYGVTGVAFGDIFLGKLRKMRERKLKTIGMDGIFPLWERDTKVLAMEFIELGFMSIVTSVDTKLIDKGYIGKLFDKNFVKMLLTLGIDPCGENGEFHSFTYQGPIFQYPININALNKQ